MIFLVDPPVPNYICARLFVNLSAFVVDISFSMAKAESI